MNNEEQKKNPVVSLWLVSGGESSKPFRHEVSEDCDCTLCVHKRLVTKFMGD
jgi:hypothetical protein